MMTVTILNLEVDKARRYSTLEDNVLFTVRTQKESG